MGWSGRGLSHNFDQSQIQGYRGHEKRSSLLTIPGTLWDHAVLLGLALSMSGSESSDPWDECGGDDDDPWSELGSEGSDPWDDCDSGDDDAWSECPLVAGGHSSARERQARAATRPARARPNGSNTLPTPPSVDITPLLMRMRQGQPGQRANEISLCGQRVSPCIGAEAAGRRCHPMQLPGEMLEGDQTRGAACHL